MLIFYNKILLNFVTFGLPWTDIFIAKYTIFLQGTPFLGLTLGLLSKCTFSRSKVV